MDNNPSKTDSPKSLYLLDPRDTELRNGTSNSIPSILYSESSQNAEGRTSFCTNLWGAPISGGTQSSDTTVSPKLRGFQKRKNNRGPKREQPRTGKYLVLSKGAKNRGNNPKKAHTSHLRGSSKRDDHSLYSKEAYNAGPRDSTPNQGHREFLQDQDITTI
ncbi:hypothetical protein FXO38_20209 [Capsicum annuum]|nr:hypothetical protein FXO37_22723 [Capsicum annuum]KAF3644332.1 hypothetical protein FXO38_20209 [Capsicum annuum]